MHRSRLSRLLWTYGPTLRWRDFRLYGRRPTEKWIPIRMTQIVGGKHWLLSICRTGPVREDR